MRKSALVVCMGMLLSACYDGGLGGPRPKPEISVSPGSLAFLAVDGGAAPDSQTLSVSNSGEGTLNWAASIAYGGPGTGWLTIDPLNGSSTGEADAIAVSVDQTGLAVTTHSASITVSDPLAENNPVVVQVTLEVRTPEAPAITSTAVTTGEVGVAYSYDVEATGFPAPTYNLTVNPTGMTIDGATGVISWTPSAGQGGLNDVTVEASSVAGTDTQSFQIAVDEAPTITSTAATTAQVGVAYSYDVDASGYPVPTFALTVSPTGMSIDSGTGVITWTPTAGQVGPNDVTVTATNASAVDQQSFQVTVGYNGPVWYVDCDATAGANNGSSWADAFLEVQDAMAAASAGHEIWVAEGTYVRQGSDDVVLTMKDGVSIYGGFAGTESARDERDPAAHVTTLDGETVVYHVVVGASNATLDGFTVTRGNANGVAPDNEGGGIRAHQCADLTIRDCTLSANLAQTIPGAYITECTGLVLERGRVHDHTCPPGTYYIVSITDTSGTVESCWFDHNDAIVLGVANCSPAIRNCVFTENTTGVGVPFDVRGAGADPTIANCVFTGNVKNHGAFFIQYDAHPQIVNCVIWGNTATETGQQIYLKNNGFVTVSYSNVQGSYTGTGNIDADPLFVDAADPDGPDDVWGTADDGLGLRAGSPCIDAADGSVAGFPEQDILGLERHDDTGTPDTGVPAANGKHPDMGAYEFQGMTSEFDVTFTEMGGSAGVAHTGSGGGAGFFDYDGDGYQDLYLCNNPGTGVMYHSNQNDTFGDTTAATGTGLGNCNCVSFADYDNDGDKDFLVFGTGRALYRNTGAGTFTDVLAASGLATPPEDGQYVAWADYDRDGNVDVAITCAAVFLCRNNGDGTFSDTTAAAGLSGGGTGVAWIDFDVDGWPDLFLAGAPWRVWRNMGDGTFTDATASVGISVSTANSYTRALVGFFDAGGYPDLIVGGHGTTPTYPLLFLNNGDGTFSESTTGSGLEAVGEYSSPLPGDYNNDGFTDIFVDRCRYGGANQLFLGGGDGTFVEVGATAGVDIHGAEDSQSVCVGDMNNDGFLDVYETNFTGGPGSTNRLYRSNGNGNHWIEFVLQGTASNRTGIGARVRIAAAGRTFHRCLSMSANAHKVAQNNPRLHFGLGAATVAETVEITWPSGLVQTLTDVAADQILTVTEELVAEEMTPMNDEHNNGGVVAYDGKLYVWTGYSVGDPGDRTSTLEVYDPATGVWSDLASVPGARNGIGEFELGGNIYSIGGEGPTSASFSSAVYRYDPVGNSWATMNSFPTNIWDPMSVVCAGKAYLVGGRHGYGQTYSHVYEYVPGTDSWATKATMLYAVFFAGTAAIDGKIYVLGGWYKPNEATNTWTQTVQIYDPSVDTWAYGDDMPWQLQNAHAVASNGHIYVFSTSVWDDGSSSWIPNDYVCRYTPSTDTWVRFKLTSPIELHYRSEIVTIDGYAYVTQEWEGATASPRVVRIPLP